MGTDTYAEPRRWRNLTIWCTVESDLAKILLQPIYVYLHLACHLAMIISVWLSTVWYIDCSVDSLAVNIHWMLQVSCTLHSCAYRSQGPMWCITSIRVHGRYLVKQTLQGRRDRTHSTSAKNRIPTQEPYTMARDKHNRKTDPWVLHGHSRHHTEAVSMLWHLEWYPSHHLRD